MLYVNKCIPRTQEDVGDIHIASETGSPGGIFETTESTIRSKINISAGVTLAFAYEAMVYVFPVTQSVPILDHTVGKKIVQETCPDEISSKFQPLPHRMQWIHVIVNRLLKTRLQ